MIRKKNDVFRVCFKHADLMIKAEKYFDCFNTLCEANIINKYYLTKIKAKLYDFCDQSDLKIEQVDEYKYKLTFKRCEKDAN